MNQSRALIFFRCTVLGLLNRMADSYWILKVFVTLHCGKFHILMNRLVIVELACTWLWLVGTWLQRCCLYAHWIKADKGTLHIVSMFAVLICKWVLFRAKHRVDEQLQVFLDSWHWWDIYAFLFFVLILTILIILICWVIITIVAWKPIRVHAHSDQCLH